MARDNILGASLRWGWGGLAFTVSLFCPSSLVALVVFLLLLPLLLKGTNAGFLVSQSVFTLSPVN